MSLLVSPIFEQTYKSAKNGTRRVIHQGGMSSGKTVNILGAYAALAAEDTPGVTTVTSMSFPHLKAGALRDFEMFIYPEFKSVINTYNKTDHVFIFDSGHLLEFRVFENEINARGPKRRRLFINEANKFPYMTYFQLDKRSDFTTIDYNPSVKFWAHEHLIGADGNKLFISDHRHNPFLSEDKHREIECIYDFVNKKGDFELFKVYARGLTGNVLGLVFPNWTRISESDFPSDEDWIWSVDFGYTNDPTCIIKQCRIGNKLFVKELSYKPGMSQVEIKDCLLENGFVIGVDFIYCEHDPDMIKSLRNLSINALFARKGQGSISAGILLLNQYEVFFVGENINKEKSLYKYEVDKDGNSTNVPVDKYNHAFDATRYGAYSHFLRGN